MGVSSTQRFTAEKPCPVCGGYDQAERGSGERCHGWLSVDSRYANCSREEHAGSLEINQSSSTFAHYIGGQCRCGQPHGAISYASPNGKVTEEVRTPAHLDPEKDKIFWYRDLSGTARYAAVRFGGKKDKAAQAYKEDGQWWLKKPDDWVLDLPYRVSEVLEAIKNGELVHVFEGETDVEAARKLGLTATTNFGGALKFSDKLVPFFSGATVIVNQDNDERGKEHALDVALRLHGTADVIKLMPPFESVGEGGDFKDWLANGGTKEKYLQMVDQMPLYRPQLSEALVVGTLLSDVESKPIRWCWKQRIALGKLNMLDGDPGLGKSLVGVDLGARVSVGAKMPDGTDGIGPCGVVLLSAEDDLADTVRPRWIKAGGDPTRLLHVFQIKAGGKERTVTIPEDVSVIEAAIKRVGARVVIIDPLSAFWGPNVRTHIDTDVRQALNPLKDMAERLDVAVIMVRHLNKSHSGNAIYRGGGSIGIIGAARSGLIVGKHPENDSIRIVAPSKVNISKEAPSLSFTITSDGEDEPPRIVWGGKTDVQANDLAVAPQSEEKRTALEDAKEWLAELLDGGSVEAEVVETKARKAEIKMATLRRAKKKVNVVSEKIGDKWYWMLPIPPDDGGGQGAQGGGGKEDAHLKKNEHLEESTRKIAYLQGKEDAQVDEHLEHLDEHLRSTDSTTTSQNTVTNITTHTTPSREGAIKSSLRGDTDYSQDAQVEHLNEHLGSHKETPANKRFLETEESNFLQDAQILEDEHLDRLGFYVDTAEKLDELVASLATHTEIAIDTETYPIDETNAAVDPRRGKVRIIAVAAGDDVLGVIDARAVNPRPLLDALQGKTLVAFNAQFDLAFLRRQFRYEHCGPVVDPCVLDVVLKFAGKVGDTTRYTDKGRQKRGFDPHRKHYRKLGEALADYVPDAGNLGKEEQASDWGADNLSDEQLEYAAKDAQVLIPLAEAMRQKFEEADMMRIYDLENRFTPALAYTQDNGFALDVAGWKERCARKEEELFDLKSACDELAPVVLEDAGFTEWAWTGSSHRRVGLALELLGADVKKNGKGNYQTSESDLETIASPEAAKNLAQAVLRYREAQKQLSTWGMSWFDPPRFRPKARKYKYNKSHQFVVNGRVHGRFNQVVRTGRISSEAPNFQNIPPVIRDHFIAPPRRRLVIGDFEQIEYVVLAALTQEEALMEGFRHGEDIHTRVAKTVFGLEEVSKADRKKAKEVSFGIAYGISDYGLATRLSRTLGREVTETEAHDLIATYLDTMPKVKLWYFNERSMALSGDKITKTMAGRLRLLDKTKSKRGKWYLEPSLRLNTPVQGSAGDGFKYAAALAHERLAECPGNPMVVNYVHDELVLEVDEDHTAAATEWLKTCMIDGMTEVLGEDHRDLINVDLRDSDVWRETEDD